MQKFGFFGTSKLTFTLMLGLLVGLSTFLSACSFNSAAPADTTGTNANPASLETVRVAYNPSVLFGPLYVAIERGYFKQQGLNIDLQPVTAGQDAMALAGAGQLDIVVAGIGAANYNAVQRGIGNKIVASMGFQPATGYPSALLVRKELLDNGTIKTLDDLKGHKVAAAGGKGSTSTYYLTVKLRESHITLQDLELVNLTFADMITAMNTKAVDAAFVPAPQSSEIIRNGSGAVFGGPIKAGISGTAVIYGEPFLKNKSDLGRKFLAAMILGARDLQGDKYFSPQTLDIFTKYTKIQQDVLKGMDRYDFDPNLKLDTATIQDMQTVFLANGYLTYKEPLALDKLVDDAYQKAALKSVGPFGP